MNKQQLRALAASAATSTPIRKFEAGASLGLTSRDWRAMTRSDRSEDDLIKQRRVIVLANGQELVVNGLGEPL